MPINTSYGSNSITTQTDPMGIGALPGGGDFNTMLRELYERRKRAMDMQERMLQEQNERDREMHIRGRRAFDTDTRNAAEDRSESKRLLFDASQAARRPAPQTMRTPWYSYQGAATRPTGLSPGMVPGMAADPRLLPLEMRPQASGFEGPVLSDLAPQRAADANEQRIVRAEDRADARSSRAEEMEAIRERNRMKLTPQARVDPMAGLWTALYGGR